LCGSPVNLSSTHRMEKMTEEAKELLHTEGMAIHLMSKHFSEYFPEINNEARDCQLCNKLFDDHQTLKYHLVNSHSGRITDLVESIIGGSLQTSLRPVKVKFLFAGLDCAGYVDTIGFDFKLLEEVGLAMIDDTAEEVLDSAEAPPDVLETDEVPEVPEDPKVPDNPEVPNLFSFKDLVLLHRSDNVWTCDLCSESFSSGSQESSFHLWKNHIISHFEEECQQHHLSQYKCQSCHVKMKTKLSMVSHIAFVHKKIDPWLNAYLAPFPEKLDSILQRIEAAKSTAQDHKRKLSSDDAVSAKKVKLEEPILSANNEQEEETGMNETFDCDICQTSFVSSSEDAHMFSHVQDDLQKALEGKTMKKCCVLG